MKSYLFEGEEMTPAKPATMEKHKVVTAKNPRGETIPIPNRSTRQRNY